mmetsp:Transcript_17216/g.41079  ORF Transcript_17216/g.41079 Transcript_17216/m.41079 type:complete len:121 (-) Transcript_17216:2281-2643(-)
MSSASTCLHSLSPMLTFDLVFIVFFGRRCPQITSLSRRELVDKIILLKGVLPSANIPELLYLRPSLLFSKEEDLAHAIRKMQALMPGTSPEAKLHQGGTAFWTFVELLGTSSATHVTSGG